MWAYIHRVEFVVGVDAVPEPDRLVHVEHKRREHVDCLVGAHCRDDWNAHGRQDGAWVGEMRTGKRTGCRQGEAGRLGPRKRKRKQKRVTVRELDERV